MKIALVACALSFATPVFADEAREAPPRVSLGSARTAKDLQQCLGQKLDDLGSPVVSGAASSTVLAYGQGRDQVVVAIDDDGDLRLVTVRAFRRLKAERQDEIRSCMY